MNVLLIGCKERCTEEDRKLVHTLMEMADKQYPNCVFVTMITDRGVGEFVKSRALEKVGQGQFRYRLITCDVRVYAHDLSRSDLESVYHARNASPAELGEVCIYLANDTRKSTLEELLRVRAGKTGMPVKVLLPGDAPSLP